MSFFAHCIEFEFLEDAKILINSKQNKLCENTHFEPHFLEKLKVLIILNETQSKHFNYSFVCKSNTTSKQLFRIVHPTLLPPLKLSINDNKKLKGY